MRILLATDGSEYSDHAASKLCDLVEIDESTTIRVISVVEPIAPTAPFGVSDDYYVQARESIKSGALAAVDDAFKLIIGCLGGADVAVEKGTINGQPKEAIINEAENWNADMIVVGSHGRGFWGRMLLGSVSNAIVKHAGCSVLVVRMESGDKE